MTSIFFAVIFVPLACTRRPQGCGDHKGVTLVFLWVLDKVLGPRLGVHLKYCFVFPSFHPSFHKGSEKAPLWTEKIFPFRTQDYWGWCNKSVLHTNNKSLPSTERKKKITVWFLHRCMRWSLQACPKINWDWKRKHHRRKYRAFLY